MANGCASMVGTDLVDQLAKGPDLEQMLQNTVKTRFGAISEDICGFKHCMAMLGHLGRPLSKDGVAAKS
jgi:hypothetical protein